MKFIYIDFVATRDKNGEILTVKTIGIDVEREEYAIWDECGVMWERPKKFEERVEDECMGFDKSGIIVTNENSLPCRSVDRDEQEREIKKAKQE